MDQPEKPKRRRKGKLDERMQAEICAVVGVGASLRAAARLVGCSATAIAKLAERDDDFRERLFAATMKREVGPLQNIRNAGQTNWRAAAWLLQRLNPGEYVPGKPEVVTRPQITAILERFAALVRDDVPEDRRAELERRIAEIVRRECEEQEVDQRWRDVPRRR
jgi:hypothetical protein